MDSELFLGGLWRVLLGALIAMVGTLVGTGGGWAMVPAFTVGFGFSHSAAAATSLCVVFLNALSGTISYARQGRVQYSVAVLFAACTIPGALIGARLNQFLDARTFATSFGVFLLLVAVVLVVGKERMVPAGGAHSDALTSRQKALGAAVSSVVGVISSVLGVGGGLIHVPFLLLVLRLPLHVATATSHFVLAVTSLVGVITYALAGEVHWYEALTMGAGALVGAPWGARLSTVLPAKTIQRFLAVLLVCFAALLIAGIGQKN